MPSESTFYVPTQSSQRPYTYHLKPLSAGNSQMNPPPQRTTDKSFDVQSSTAQIDWIMESFHKEIDSHNETRSNLQSCRQINVQLERLLYQERSFNHNLRVTAQEAEYKRIAAEGRLRAYEQQIESSLSLRTPLSASLSDYKSTTFSPSINLTLPPMGMVSELRESTGKRNAEPHTSTRQVHKKARGASSPVTPESMQSEES